MAISETVLILAGGTAVLSILFGIRLAMRALAGGAAAPRSDGGQAAGGSGAPDVAGVIALPPLIFLGFLAAATVLEAILPLPIPVAHSLASYVAGVALAAGGFVMIAMGTQALCGRRHQHSADPADHGAGGGWHLWANPEPALLGNDPSLPGPERRGGKPVGDRAAGAAAVGDQCRRR